MFIKGKKVGLRAMEPSDTDLLYHWENKMELWSSGQTLAPYSHFNIEQFVRYSSKDIYEAKQLRLMIKKVNENLYLGVRPNLVAQDRFLASINESSNGVELFSNNRAESYFKAENRSSNPIGLLSLDLINAAKFIEDKVQSSFNFHPKRITASD